MGFNGLLFQFGDYKFPNEYIKIDTYDIAPNQRQDLDSFTNGKGVTVRNALEHTKTQVQFTIMGLWGKDMSRIIEGLRTNYINYKERDAYCTYFDSENYEYKTGHFYLDPSVKFRVKKINEAPAPDIYYGETVMLFIEY